jgi:hypothetical protein
VDHTLIVTTQRQFHIYFSILRHASVHSLNTAKAWTHNTLESASALNRQNYSVKTPENAEEVSLLSEVDAFGKETFQ